MYSEYRTHSNAMASESDFNLLYSGKANNVIPVYKYASKKTGLTVVIAQVEGPLVNGYFCLGESSVFKCKAILVRTSSQCLP